MSRGGPSGRGRGGRGGGSGFTFNLQSINIGRGELPALVVAPQTSFPALMTKCLRPEEGEDDELLVEIKKNFTASMKATRFYQDLPKLDRGIERYSDKYSKVAERSHNAMNDSDFDPRLFPSELLAKSGKSVAKKAVIKKCVSQSLDPSVLPEQDQNIEEVTKAAKGSDDEEEEGNEDEVAAAEEDEEEETDYMQSYFDNGEEYLDGGSDDNAEDEATY